MQDLKNIAYTIAAVVVGGVATLTVGTAGYHLVQTGRWCVQDNRYANPVPATAAFIGCMNYVSQRKLGTWEFRPY